MARQEGRVSESIRGKRASQSLISEGKGDERRKREEGIEGRDEGFRWRSLHALSTRDSSPSSERGSPADARESPISCEWHSVSSGISFKVYHTFIFPFCVKLESLLRRSLHAITRPAFTERNLYRM